MRDETGFCFLTNHCVTFNLIIVILSFGGLINEYVSRKPINWLVTWWKVGVIHSPWDFESVTQTLIYDAKNEKSRELHAWLTLLLECEISGLWKQ